ncbi:S-layer homology domain-containing protein [Paenibacillus sp. SAFN-117]|uniref:S-layer homology domain-containing protein n=1 Tax=Paenibacillus sp. SAFN-117 TaxID=3436860 RepID=UPI003F7F0925
MMKVTKRYLSILLSFSIIFGIFPLSGASAADMGNGGIVNPGFEMDLVDGTIPGWSLITQNTISTVTVSTYKAHSGSKSLHFHNSSAEEQLQVSSQAIPVVPGGKYNAKAFAYVVSQTHSIGYEVHYYNNQGDKVGKADFINFAKGKLKLNEWNELVVRFEVPAEATQIQLRFNSGRIAVTEVYFDDVSIELLEAPSDTEYPREVLNPGFEQDAVDARIPHWAIDPVTSGTVELSKDRTHNGTYSLHFVDSVADAGSTGLRVFSDKIAVAPNESYIASSFVNVVKQTHNIVLEVHYYNAQDVRVAVKQELFSGNSLGTNQWSEMKLLTTAPAGAAYARIGLYSGGISLTEAYFDDAAFEIVPPEVPLERDYQEPVDLGPMVSVSLGQAGAIQQNVLGDNEVYFHTNGKPGTFVVVDGETGKLKFSQVIPNTEATWAMTIGPDQNVYFAGTGDGKLYRYLPAKKEVELLGVNPSDSWVWDLEAAPDGKIYGATYNDKSYGKVFEYDIHTGKFRDYGTIMDGQDYVRGIAVDEKYIYAGLGTSIHLFRIDRVTGEKTEIIIPDNELNLATGDTGTIADVFVVNGKLFVSVSTINMVVMNMETYEIEHTFQYSNMISEPSPFNPNLIYYKNGTELFQYDFSTNRSSQIELSVPLPDTIRVKDMQWIKLQSGPKAGQTVLTIITQYGEYILYDPTDQWLSFIELEISPQPVAIQALEKGTDGRIYLGGYQRGMSIYNPFTNQIDLNISSFAQPEGIGFLNDHVYYGTYVAAVMYRLDPSQPMELNTNPRMVYPFENMQDRPFAITSGDNKLFVGTVPDYGLLGGSLAIYDETADHWTQFDNFVENQSIMALAYKDGYLYGGTTIWGGLGINPSEPAAKLFIWDVAKGRKVAEFTPQIPGIDEAPKMIGELSFGPDGYLWGAVDGTIFAMDVDTNEVVKSKLIRPSLYNSSKWKPYRLEWSPDGMLYTTLSRKLIVIDPETLQHKTIVDGFVNDMAIGIDGSIYYSPDASTNMSRIAIPETDATLSAIHVNGMPLESFSPGILQYTYPLSSADDVQAVAKQPEAVVHVESVSEQKQTIIHVTAKDGKSTLQYKINWKPADPRETAIQEAIAAIAALPANITLKDKPAVVAARAKVETALRLGAQEADITNLKVLIAAEARIAFLEKPADPRETAIQEAIAAIAALPASITLKDKPAVVAARSKVETALRLGAQEADITNLEVLIAAEARIAFLEKPTEEEPPQPSWGGYVIPKDNSSNEQQLVLQIEDLRQEAENGKVTVAVPKKVNQVILPGNAFEALGQNRLVIETDTFAVELPADLLKQWSDKAAITETTDSQVEININRLPSSEAEKRLGELRDDHHAAIKLSGEIIDLSLIMVAKDGQRTSLSPFHPPMTIRAQVDSALNPNLVGLYYMTEDGTFEYVGGSYIEGEWVADIHRAGTYAVLEFKKRFIDIQPSHWAKDAIEELAAKQMITGTSSTTFEPDRSVTRAEFTALLIRALNLTQAGVLSFTDVEKGAWYEEPISIAVQSGIANGKSATVFDPNGDITRQEMVTMLIRAYKISKGVEWPDSMESGFTDESNVSPWALEYVRAAAALHLIEGREQGKFIPDGISTRAEAAMLLKRLLQQ